MATLRMFIVYLLLTIFSCSDEKNITIDEYDISSLSIEKISLTAPLLHFDFCDKFNGIGVDAGNIYKTNDGGISWEQIHKHENLRSVNLFNKDNVLISGNENSDNGNSFFVLISDDAGATFKMIFINSISSQVLSISTFNDGSAYITTHNGIHRSSDFGKSWMKITNIGIVITKIIKSSDNKLYGGSNEGIILVSDDYGVEWSQINTKFDSYIYIKAILDDRIYFLTGGELYSTENFVDYINHNIYIDKTINFLHVLENGNMAYFGSKYSNGGGFVPNGIIYLTNNNGKSWSENDFGAKEEWSGFENGIKITDRKIIIKAIEGYENNQLLHINFN